MHPPRGRYKTPSSLDPFGVYKIINGLKKRCFMFKKLYDWLITKADHPHASWYLWGASFLESFISPIPPDLLLVPMIIGRPKQAWWYAFLCTSASVIGGIIGYGIGYFLFATVGQWILELYGLQASFEAFQSFVDKWGFVGIVLKGLTPIPYKFVTITCGVAQFDFWEFLAASTLSRGMRFYIEAAFLWMWGPAIHTYMQRYTTLAVAALTILLVLGVVALKYINFS